MISFAFMTVGIMDMHLIGSLNFKGDNEDELL